MEVFEFGIDYLDVSSLPCDYWFTPSRFMACLTVLRSLVRVYSIRCGGVQRGSLQRISPMHPTKNVTLHSTNLVVRIFCFSFIPL